MIGWLIGIGLLLLLIAVLLLPLTFRFDIDDPQNRRFYRLSWVGIPLFSNEGDGLFQRKSDDEGAEQPEKKSKRKKREKPEDAENESESKGEKIKQYWGMAKDALSALPKPLRRLWKGFSVRRLVVGIQVGRFDAKECAVAYGAVCAALYPALGLLQEAMHVKLEQVTVQCAFGQEKNRYVICGVMRFCPLAAVVGAFSFLLGFAWKYLRRTMHEKKNESAGRLKQAADEN